jgi:hypothetical protein
LTVRRTIYDIFAATDREFFTVFPSGQDIAFIDEVILRTGKAASKKLWARRLRKHEAHGMHGILFYDLAHKKVYYPTRRDEEAVNPGGSKLR